MVYGYIYKIENLVNGKVYIGLTTKSNPLKRKKEHIRVLKQNKHNNPHLQHAFNKYGESNFNFTVLNYATDKKTLDKLEIDYMFNYNCLDRNKGYNIKTGGSKGNLSLETKRKLSINASCYWKGKHLSKETRRKLSKSMKEYHNNNPSPMKGKALSTKTKMKISNTLKGRKLPTPTIKKLLKTHRGMGLFGFTGTSFLKNKNPERKCWKASFRYRNNSNFLGIYEDPFTAEIVHDFVIDAIYSD